MEVFNTLLRHLRISVDKNVAGPNLADEKNFQEAIINTIGRCWMKTYVMPWNFTVTITRGSWQE